MSVPEYYPGVRSFFLVTGNLMSLQFIFYLIFYVFISPSYLLSLLVIFF